MKNSLKLTKTENAGLVAAWIAALILAGWLLFFFTDTIQNNTLVDSANRVLEQAGDVRRLERRTLGRNSLGTWHRVVGGARAESGRAGQALIFSIMDNGIFVPCIAFVDVGGEVNLFPLNSHAREVFPRIPEGVVDVYLKRIAKEAQR